MPAVSVVVPCYNGGHFIDQLLASLAQQTFRDFELIIVDDGSRDETRAKLATLDKSVTVIRRTMPGPAPPAIPGSRAPARRSCSRSIATTRSIRPIWRKRFR